MPATVVGPDGSVDAPGFTFRGERQSLGFYRKASKTIVSAIGGADAVIHRGSTLAEAGLRVLAGLIGYETGSGGAVTQQTNSATAVTLNKVCGQITTVALTTAAAAEERFTVNNSKMHATDVVVLSTTYNGAGTPALAVVNVTATSFDIVITNLHASAAFNAVMVINFAILRAVAA